MKGVMDMKFPKFCKKRDGSVVSFEKNRIVGAIHRAFIEAEEGNRIIAQKVTESVVEKIMLRYTDEIPYVEDIQDIVEDVLMSYNFRQTAKKYILYRDKHNRNRKIVGV
jgi:anaerobic ribonucleoside-triphosphate reductase